MAILHLNVIYRNTNQQLFLELIAIFVDLALPFLWDEKLAEV